MYIKSYIYACDNFCQNKNKSIIELRYNIIFNAKKNLPFLISFEFNVFLNRYETNDEKCESRIQKYLLKIKEY